MSRLAPPPKVWPDERETMLSRRLWAAVVLTSDLRVCRSILWGLPVLAKQLDAEALRRALRGKPFPPPASYVELSADMLDAVAEGGGFG